MITVIRCHKSDKNNYKDDDLEEGGALAVSLTNKSGLKNTITKSCEEQMDDLAAIELTEKLATKLAAKLTAKLEVKLAVKLVVKLVVKLAAKISAW